MCFATPSDFRRVDDVIEVALLYVFPEFLDLSPELLNFIKDLFPFRLLVFTGGVDLLGFLASLFFPVCFDLLLLFIGEGVFCCCTFPLVRHKL